MVWSCRENGKSDLPGKFKTLKISKDFPRWEPRKETKKIMRKNLKAKVANKALVDKAGTHGIPF